MATTDSNSRLGLDGIDPADLRALVEIKYLGGIEEAETEFTPGLTVLSGENTTGRTSFLKSLTSILGGSAPSVNEHSDEGAGSISLEIQNDDDLLVDLEQKHTQKGSVVGDSLYSNEKTVDTFISLLERNPAREAVENIDSESLRDLLMQPLDVAAIEAELSDLKSTRKNKRQELDDKNRQIGGLTEKIEEKTKKENRLEEIQSELSDKQTSLSDVEDELESHSQDQPDTDLDEEISSVESEVDDLQATKRDIVTDIDVLEDSIEAVERDIEEVRSKLATHYNQEIITKDVDSLNRLRRVDVDAEPPVEEQIPWSDVPSAAETVEDIEAKRSDLAAQEEEFNSLIDSINEITGFISDELENNRGSTIRDAEEQYTDTGTDTEKDSETQTTSADELTSQLTASSDTEERECVVCGASITQKQLEQRHEHLDSELKSAVSKKRYKIIQRINSLDEEIETITSDVEQLYTLKTDLEDKQAEIQRYKSELEDKKPRLSDVEDELADKQAELDQLREQKEDVEQELFEQRDTIQRKITELELEQERVEETIAEIEAEIEEAQQLKPEAEKLETEIDDLSDSIKNQREKIVNREDQVVEEFNTQMESLVSALDYENIDRIWLEVKNRSETGLREAEGFKLNVIRNGQNRSIETFSESEREMIGMVVALAGYLAHDLDDEIPFILIDSVEAFDNSRLEALLEYFADKGVFVVAALLPEDEQSLTMDYDQQLATDIITTNN
ncbi:AAA family ATPase [Halovenus sp. HT40]|uniref:AAA family ATPase n=1 Tax=Halovenus sp. HT40 TaxID=3126691 RepID=UPI00300F6FFB